MAVEKVVFIRDYDRLREPDAVHDRDPAQRDAVIVEFPKIPQRLHIDMPSDCAYPGSFTIEGPRPVAISLGTI